MSDHVVVRALWYVEPLKVELRSERIEVPRGDMALVRSLYSGISRGTERLVFSGNVPEAEFHSMRAPMQSGDFPFPVKYGYCATGRVESGPKDLIGRDFFCLHPHQDLFFAASQGLVEVPCNVPARRATLAANMETALNAHWDAASGPCDSIAIVGAGVVGLLTAYLAARLPGADVIVIDSNPARAEIAEAFGAKFALPGDDLPDDRDVVFHASASAGGLKTALGMAGMEGRVVEMSWYGAKEVAAPLGGAFHSRRLKLISTQVGQIADSRRPRWNYARRIAAAMKLLDRPELDLLVNEEIAFEDAPMLLPGILDPESAALAPVIRYK
ncbi:MAG: zinc-binding alcohol dehydrogenase [Alphaproteobacteria bacterium]|nr:zinc-binding alcohol dehydrogenase [Alphaproteobacteria bacterium]